MYFEYEFSNNNNNNNNNSQSASTSFNYAFMINDRHHLLYLQPTFAHVLKKILSEKSEKIEDCILGCISKYPRHYGAGNNW